MSVQLPLTGKRILVTRPIHQSASLSDALKANGAEPVEMPLIRICPPDSWQEFDAAFRSLDIYDWVIFASANAADATLARAKTLGAGDKLLSKKIACIGSTTAMHLQQQGINCALTPSSYIAESLLSEFPVPDSASRNRVLWTRTNIGRNTLKEGLEAKGWQVDIVFSYKTEGPEDPAATAQHLLELLQSKQLYAITLASSETVNQLKSVLQIASADLNQSISALLSSVKLAVIGPETARACKQAFDRVDIQPEKYTAVGLVDAIVSQLNIE